MQIQRVLHSFRRPVFSNNTHIHINNLVRSFSIQENSEPHHKQLEATLLPIDLRMEMADKQAQELSEYIRATHGKLRNEYRKVKDPDTVWSVHIKNKEELQHYAAAMHKLAAIWEAKVEDKEYVSRINWCYQAVQSYFRKGELEKTRVKELRTVSFHLPHLVGYSYSSNATATETAAAGVKSSDTAPSKVSGASSVTEVLMETGISECVTDTSASTKEVASTKTAATGNEDASIADEVARTPNGVSIEAPLSSKESVTKEVETDSKGENTSDALDLPEVSDPKDNKEMAANTCSRSTNHLNIGTVGDHSSSQSVDGATDASSVPSMISGAADERVSERAHIAYGDRLKVLDVGSCYNPFSRYPDLDVTALDLQPATEDVYQCDFLKLNIADSDSSFQSASPLHPADQHNEVGCAENNETVTTSKVITTLPANSYDTILFSFLLSYLPSPEHRLKCCKNAYHLLKPEGALVIAAADSRGQVGNGYVYKCWQITLASLGFVRVKYEKNKDFHGMVFRKGMYPEVWRIDANRMLEEMKAKKSEMKTDFVVMKEKGVMFSKRRVQQIESFDLDKAFTGLWLPHDFKDCNEEEYVVKATKIDSPKKRKRKESTDPSEEDGEADEPVSKISKSVGSSNELDLEAEESSR